MRELSIAHLLEVSDCQIFIHLQLCTRLQSRLGKRLELDKALGSELLGDSFSDVRAEFSRVSDLERVGVDDCHFVDSLIDAIRLDLSVLVTFTLVQLHTLYVSKGALVAILKFMLLVSKKFNDSLLFVCDGSNYDILQLFTVFVEYLEVFTEVIEHSTKDASKLSVDELLSFGSAVVIDGDSCRIVCLSENNDIHRV